MQSLIIESSLASIYDQGRKLITLINAHLTQLLYQMGIYFNRRYVIESFMIKIGSFFVWQSSEISVVFLKSFIGLS